MSTALTIYQFPLAGPLYLDFSQKSPIECLMGLSLINKHTNEKYMCLKAYRSHDFQNAQKGTGLFNVTQIPIHL